MNLKNMINNKLLQDITRYCEYNNIECEKFINKLLKDAFTREKYGETPNINVDFSEIQVKEEKETEIDEDEDEEDVLEDECGDEEIHDSSKASIGSIEVNVGDSETLTKEEEVAKAFDSRYSKALNK